MLATLFSPGYLVLYIITAAGVLLGAIYTARNYHREGKSEVVTEMSTLLESLRTVTTTTLADNAETHKVLNETLKQLKDANAKVGLLQGHIRILERKVKALEVRLAKLTMTTPTRKRT